MKLKQQSLLKGIEQWRQLKREYKMLQLLKRQYEQSLFKDC